MPFLRSVRLLILGAILLLPTFARGKTVILLPLSGSVLEEKGGPILGFCDDPDRTHVDVVLNGKSREAELWDGVFSLDLDWAMGENTLTVGDQKATFTVDPYTGSPRRPSVHQAAVDSCGNCHMLGENRSLKLRAELSILCRRCHEVEPATYRHGAVSCEGCHQPHTSWEPRLLKARGNTQCATCHNDRTTKEDAKHGGLWDKTPCTKCHESHVPQAKNVGKKCGECHQSDAAASSAHVEAEQTRCGSCHFMHSKAGKTHSNEPARACVGCHPQGKDSAHEKQLSDCSACHDFHQKRPLGNQEASCKPCHEKAFTKKHQHDPAAAGNCAVCHPVHNLRNRSLATASCIRCHTAEKLKTTHRGVGIAVNTCVGCHRLHDSDEPHFLSKAQHTPFRERRCDDCHKRQGFKSDRTYTGPWAPLCLTCHEPLRSAMTHGPAKEGNCRSCHAAHGSPNEGLLKAPLLELCSSCHAAVAKAWGGAHASDTTCTSCHNPHGGQEAHHLKRPVNALCTRCHRDPTLELGGVLKPSVHSPILTSGCAICHDPHAKSGHHLRKPQRQLCVSCHKDFAAGAPARPGGTTVHKPVAQVPCTGCHNPHAGEGKNLLP